MWHVLCSISTLSTTWFQSRPTLYMIMHASLVLLSQFPIFRGPQKGVQSISPSSDHSNQPHNRQRGRGHVTERVASRHQVLRSSRSHCSTMAPFPYLSSFFPHAWPCTSVFGLTSSTPCAHLCTCCICFTRFKRDIMFGINHIKFRRHPTL